MYTVLETDFGNVGFYCLHLDHQLEETRIAQWKQVKVFYFFLFFETMKDFLASNNDLGSIPHVIFGDFNSLSSEKDYSKRKWEEIIRVRENNYWERPKTDLIQMVKDTGYTDCWKEGSGSPDTATCWANTRIDYIFGSTEFMKKFKPIATKAVDNDASDHRLIYIDFVVQ